MYPSDVARDNLANQNLDDILLERLSQYQDSPLFEKTNFTTSAEGHLLVNGQVPYNFGERTNFWNSIEESHKPNLMPLKVLKSTLSNIAIKNFQNSDKEIEMIQQAITKTVLILKEDETLLKRLSILYEQKQDLFLESIFKSVIATKIAINASVDTPLEQIFTTSLFSNVGELIIPEMVYPKEKRSFRPSQIKLLKEHPIVSCLLFNRNLFPEHIFYSIATHHINLNGTGYPNTLLHFPTTLESQIINISSTFVESRMRDCKDSTSILKLLDFFSRHENALGDTVMPLYNRDFLAPLQKMSSSLDMSTENIPPKIKDRKILLQTLGTVRYIGLEYIKKFSNKIDKETLRTTLTPEIEASIDLMRESSQNIKSISKFLPYTKKSTIASLDDIRYNSLATDVELICDEIARYSVELGRHLNFYVELSKVKKSKIAKYFNETILPSVRSFPTRPLQKYLGE